ncbi:uncharacterized protein LOC129236975 [Anastrepha obliqua]|uniref:uncharacterized protein LOC129236975 n=1 Tax=Anastrepha obliqua TaxID=95512 RepID=UPI002409E3EE|nr:uncharacterized protein LOC129236975 [Anastrepha obliqua]
MAKSFLITIFVLAFALLSDAKLRFLIDEVNGDHEAYAELALYMTERYISPKTSTLIIMEQCEHCQPGLQNMHTRLMRHFLKRFNPTMSLQLSFGLPEGRLWDYNIFIVDSMEAFKHLSIHIPVTRYEYQFHFFVILTLRTKSSKIANEQMGGIFRECLRFHVDNVVIMFQLEDNKFGFFTYDPFGKDFCRQIVQIIEFNTYVNGNLTDDRLFPPHLRDFHGCTLNICVQLSYPFMGFKGDHNDLRQLQDINKLVGIEADLLKDLSKALNFRVNISIPKEDSVIGEFNDSKGCFVELNAGKTDIAIGCLSSSDGLRHVFSYSVTYHQSPYVFIVRSGLHFGPIKQLVLAFRTGVWIAIGCCCVVGMIFIRLIVRYTNRQICEKIVGTPRRSDSTNLIVVLMGNPIKALPRHNSARLLLMSWLLATLVLRNAYQANLFDTLRISRRIPVPRSISGLEDKNYVLLSDKYVDFYQQNMTTIVRNLSKRYSLIQNSVTSRLTTYSTLDVLAWHNQQNWQTSRLTYVDEPIYPVQISMFFKKHSMMRAFFNYRIKQFMAAGITSHIASKHVSRSYEIINTRPRRLPAISSNMLKGLYLLYSMLMGLACALFALELLSEKLQGMKRVVDWMHCVESN